MPDVVTCANCGSIYDAAVARAGCPACHVNATVDDGPDGSCTAWLAEWPNGRTHVLDGPPTVRDGEMDGAAGTPELAIAWWGKE